ncbi:Cyclic nucleotide-gated cation channel alpha-3 [Symbiodinium microadriaticum]|uniref:Cyclic nucleotide-gated cation channel alpha-3 n=1 Tax=Symbiodinium microadriaticum TaxID=2951 RepID=A0A1Q9EHB0_SYMMI|nr:Cyclic nucleotide-gated cation channel alpha-3 [Symbiodinium microadriaticum]CAE7946924.1 CNGA3 [Symbiodinium sp. KB8]
MASTSLEEGIQNLEAELNNAFARIQKHLKVLRQDVGSPPTPVEGSILSAGTGRRASWKVPDSLGDWLLKDDVMSMPHEDPAPSSLGGDALFFSAEMLGASAHSHMRLNSHLMELSMRAAESAHVLKKERMKTGYLSPSKEISQYTSGGANTVLTELERCESILQVIPPNSKFRLAWDLCGVLLIVLDAFLLPMTMAWSEWEVTPMPSSISFSSRVLQIFAIISLAFWPCDIIVNFNTAFYVRGFIETRRWEIAKRYAYTWLGFDICVVLLDFAAGFLGQASEDAPADFLQPLRSARYLRILRTIRILRILKAGKINVLLENLVISMGRQWMILAFTVGKMLIAIGAVAHILACIWFALGDTVQSAGQHRSWLEFAGITREQGATFEIQYIHSLIWMLLPPSPPPLDPFSGIEHAAVLILFVTTVLVIGSALSILTGTLNEIRQVNSERSKKRRELRIFLQTRAVSTELLMRVMSYADYRMTRHSPVAYDPSLISPMLEAELATSQFGSILNAHPLFEFISSSYPAVFAECCRVLNKHFYCEGEAVFSEGSLAEKMHISSHGTFKLTAEAYPQDHALIEDDCHYFAEISLYVEAAVHRCSLHTDSFSEVFSLTAADFAKILVNSPLCTTMVIEYANEYISCYTAVPATKEGGIWHKAEWERECAQIACTNNSFYLEEHVDNRQVLEALDLASPQNSLEGAETPYAAAWLGANGAEATLTPMDFVTSVVPGQGTADSTVASLREAFLELDLEHGLHARFSDAKEQERAESAILSLVALARNDYDMYTAAQNQQNRLTNTQWQNLRELFDWTDATDEKLLAVIFLLAVKGISKYRSLTRQLPVGHQRPEKAMKYILELFPLAVPSAASLSSDAQEMMAKMLDMQGIFNFAQMLQGENVPANLGDLKSAVQSYGTEELLKFYVLYLLGFMSGLAGGKGSRFMTRSNARATLLGLAMLKHVLEQDPAPLYWTYIHHRGLELSRRAEQPSDLALLRLACNCRAQTADDLARLQDAWDHLTAQEQVELTKHFLADGITTPAIVCEFLPLCLERARSNPFVTVRTLLQVLVELLQAVRSAAPKDHKIVTVDLADLAAFILMVQNSYVFQTCLARATLSLREERFYVDVSQENWRRIAEPPSDIVLLAGSVRELVYKSRRHDDAKSAAQQQVLVHCHF